MSEFRAFPRISRVKPEGLHVTVTEKIDGSNGCLVLEGGKLVSVQSRKRVITPGKATDNMGFASWAEANREAIESFFPDGYHYGEWAGPGIQKNIHNLEHKMFFLFNVGIWTPELDYPEGIRPVPVLFDGIAYGGLAEEFLGELDPLDSEGVMVYYHDFGKYLKFTHNNNPKGAR